MEDYHILSKAEVSALLQKRVGYYQKLASTFIQQKWGNPQNAPHQIQPKLVRLLATTDMYNGDPVVDNLLNTKYWHQLPDDQIEGVINYNINRLKDCDLILSDTIRSGKQNRERQGTLYPSVFQDSNRIYIQLPTVKNHPAQIRSLIQDFNSSLPPDQALASRIQATKTDTSYFISDKASEQPLGRFLGRKISLLDLLSATLHKKSLQEQNQIAYQIQTRSMYEYSERDGNPVKVDWLKRDHHITLDTHLYAYLQKHLATSSITNTITPFIKRLSALKNSIAFEQDRQGDDEGVALNHDTNLVILSKGPRDIAWCSAYTDYEELSCMNPYGFMHHFVREDIAYGTLVAYMVNSETPHKRYSRILMKPYFNEQGEAIYYIGKTHGEKNYVFHQFLRQFAHDYLNSPRTATYTLDEHLYPDSEPQQVVYSHFLENTR